MSKLIAVERDVGRAVALLDVAEGDHRAGGGRVRARRAAMVGLRGAGGGADVVRLQPCVVLSRVRGRVRLERKVPCNACRVGSSAWRASSPPPCRTACRCTAWSCPRGPPPSLVAFDAGARTERPEENGMAHFLEHLVFKGGQKYDDYRKVNQTAETMGAVLNAYTSHDLVAFHITCRAEVAAEAIDLLTDFVGPPEDRRRGARPRARRRDPGDRARAGPAVGAGRAPDRPRGVRRASARAARCSGRRTTCGRSRATGSSRSGAASGSGARGGAFLVGNLDHLPEDNEMAELFGRFPSISANGGSEPAPAFAPTTLVEHARVRAVAPADVLPAGDRAARARRARRAERLLDAAGRLDGLAPVRRDPRAARPGLLASTRSTTPSPTCRSCSSRRAWTRPSASRPTQRMREIVDELRTDGPTEEEVERARAYAAGRRVLAFENTNAVARHAAQQTVVFGQDIDPDKAIEALDAVTFDQVVEVARGHLRVALGGLRRPHTNRPSSHRRRLPDLAVRGPQCVVGDDFEELNHRELERYVRRVSDRWPLDRALLGGARVADLRGAGAQRERGPEYVIVLVSRALRRRAVARARLRHRHAVGRLRDGRARRHARLHPRRVRAPPREPPRRARRGASGASSCSPSTPDAASHANPASSREPRAA